MQIKSLWYLTERLLKPVLTMNCWLKAEIMRPCGTPNKNYLHKGGLNETSCVRGGLPGNHPCSPKETRYGTLRRCGPAHGGVKAQRVPCSSYLAGRRLSHNGRRSLSPSDRCRPRGCRKNLRAPLLLYRAAYRRRRDRKSTRLNSSHVS